VSESKVERDEIGDLRDATRALSWLFVVGLLFVSSAARAVYSSHGMEPSARFELLVASGWITFLWAWLREKCKPYEATFPLDLALFVWWTGFFVLTYYLWRYQRWRGLAKIAAILAAYAAAYAFSVALHYVLLATSS
jgi:hypothetical protein